jgi:hypothetical protein
MPMGGTGQKKKKKKGPPDRARSEIDGEKDGHDMALEVTRQPLFLGRADYGWVSRMDGQREPGKSVAAMVDG